MIDLIRYCLCMLYLTLHYMIVSWTHLNFHSMLGKIFGFEPEVAFILAGVAIELFRKILSDVSHPRYN